MSFQISNLLKPEVFTHPVEQLELVETHISWVILTGQYAYKIKKPVNFGFLDFSTLEKRKNLCEQEVRLNRRLAQSVYLAVVPVTGRPEKPVVDGEGEAFEYAVKMSQFPQSAQLDHMLEAGELQLEHVDALANLVASFHQSAQVANHEQRFGDSELVKYPVDENFRQIREHLDTDEYEADLVLLEQWSDTEFIKLKDTIQQRKQDGFVRECHGDMHLRNLVWIDNQPMAFDCIEFNPSLSWIDVISEIAFLIMDLHSRNQQGLANRFLNGYLEATGDYPGLKLLHFYLSYRALVRAKVSVLRLGQTDLSEEEKQQVKTEFEQYLHLALNYIQTKKPQIILMQGFSASGKSTVSQKIIDHSSVIRIRSDVERKRLFNKINQPDSKETINEGIYNPRVSEKVYQFLSEQVQVITGSGFSVIVDAAFLKYWQREIFQQLASSLNVSYTILQLVASENVLRKRIVQRKKSVSDADLTVLEYQLDNWQPFLPNEVSSVITVDTEKNLDVNQLLKQLVLK